VINSPGLNGIVKFVGKGKCHHRPGGSILQYHSHYPAISNTMGFFQKCPHTCDHAPPTRNRAITYGYIFYNVGSSFLNHMKSKLHPNCSPPCLGHPNHPQHKRYTEPTVEDWNKWADQLWVRYKHNPAAQAAIPAEYLSPASHGEVAVNQEEQQRRRVEWGLIRIPTLQAQALVFLLWVMYWLFVRHPQPACLPA
jgi:hypothetical protein